MDKMEDPIKMTEQGIREMKEDLDYVKFFKIESTEEYNVGVDFGFLNNRISGSFEYYHMPTTQMIMNQSLPGFSGFPLWILPLLLLE